MTSSTDAGTGAGAAGTPGGTPGGGAAPFLLDGGTPAGQGGAAGGTPGLTPGQGASSAPQPSPQQRDAVLIDVPPELRDAKWATKYTIDGKLNVLGLAKGFEHAQTLIGGDKVPVPKDWNDPEQTSRWYAAMGRPEAPEGYKFDPVAELPQGFYQEEAEKSFRNWAYASGLGQSQAQNLRDQYVKVRLQEHQAEQTAQSQARAKVETDLRRELGQAYDGQVATAKAAFRRYADPDFVEYATQQGLLNDPRFVRIFMKVGSETMGETQAKLPNGQIGQATPQQLDEQIADFRKTHDRALRDRDHPENKLRNEQLTGLYAKRFPEERVA